MKTLFFVGRSYPHREILLEIKSLGYQLGVFADPSMTLKNQQEFDTVIYLDFTSPDTFKESFNNIPSGCRVDGLLCLYENYIAYKVLLAQKFGLPSLSIDSARACTDKFIMRSMFAKSSPEITPEYALVNTEDELLNFADQYGYPLVLKPTGLVKSLLVNTCYSREELINTYRKTAIEIATIYERQHITDRKPAIILERFIQGKLCSVAAFVDENGTPHFCKGIAELTRADEIGYEDNFLYCRKLADGIKAETQQLIFGTAAKGIAALKMSSTPAHVEIIYTENSAKIVEIGARIGGYRPLMYKQSYGINMFEQEAAIATGNQPTLPSEFLRYSAVYELFPRDAGVFSHLKNYRANNQYEYVHVVATPGENIGHAKDGYRASAIIGISQDSREAFEQKCKEVESIEVITN